MKIPMVLPLLGLLSASIAQAATVTYDFNITWVYANPDGLYERPVIGINGQWPIPRIEMNVGDHVVVNADNQLGNRSASLHFHGLYQHGNNQMDGPTGVTQCGFPPGSKFTYEFDVQQPGTYWYHAHNPGAYPDGLRGPLIVHDPQNPYADEIDDELVMTVSDWYHDFQPDLAASFISVLNPTGAEPVPDAALMNDTHNLHIDIQPGKTYFIRIINVGAFAAHYLWFEGHSMRVIEVDGIYTEAKETNMITITTAQRYGVLLTTKNETTQNYAITAAMDQDYFDAVPDTLNPNSTGWLVYDSAATLPDPTPVDDYDAALDDFTLVPYDKEPLFDVVQHNITLDFEMNDLGNGANYAFFNDISYVQPSVPTLYTVLSSGTLANEAAIYGPDTSAYILPYNKTIEIVVNSADPGKHPFHLHGHAMQVVARGEPDAGAYTPGNATLAEIPMRRDTVLVYPNSYVVLRFQANNPGVWLFHCHIEWHMETGLVATMIEAPYELQRQNLTIPPAFKEACLAQGLPDSGNAAGHGVAVDAGVTPNDVSDWMDMTGVPMSVPPLPAGFTPRGIVALVFSCISAVLGIAVVSWYGAGDIGKNKGAGFGLAEPVAEPQEVSQVNEVNGATGSETRG